MRIHWLILSAFISNSLGQRLRKASSPLLSNLSRSSCLLTIDILADLVRRPAWLPLQPVVAIVTSCGAILYRRSNPQRFELGVEV